MHIKNIHRKKWIIAGALLLVAVCVWIVMSKMVVLSDENTPRGGLVVDLDDNAVKYEAPLPPDRSGAKSGIKIPGYERITIPANTAEVKFTLLNPEGNPCYFTFELVLDDTEETIYQSKMVEPSMCIEYVTLNRPLEAGEYAMTVKIRTFALDSLTSLNGANVSIKLIVI